LRHQRCTQRRQAGQRFAQARQVARPRIAQRDAAGDALDVGDAAQGLAHLTGQAAIVVEQAFDGAMAQGGNVALAQRVVQRVAQQAGTHAGHAVVEQREQGRRRLAAQGFGEFEVAPGGEVQSQVGAFQFYRQATQVRQLAGLRCLGVLQQRTGCGNGGLQALGAEAGQRGHFELVAEQAARRVVVEIPVRLAGAGYIEVEIGRPALRVEDFRRANALQRGGNLLGRHFDQDEFAARQVQAGDAGRVALCRNGEQPDVLLVVDQRRIGQRARRDDARHGPLDRPLAGCRVADLFADDGRFAELDQPGKVGFQRMKGHATHLDRHPGRLATRGQRNVEQTRGFFGVFVEKLVEIAHPVKQQGVRVLGLERQVLNHHGRVLGLFVFCFFCHVSWGIYCRISRVLSGAPNSPLLRKGLMSRPPRRV